jgi:hypothetical protein
MTQTMIGLARQRAPGRGPFTDLVKGWVKLLLILLWISIGPSRRSITPLGVEAETDTPFDAPSVTSTLELPLNLQGLE